MKQNENIDIFALSNGITADSACYDPSCAVAVFCGGERLWRGLFGWADRDKGRPLDERSTFVLDCADGLLLGLSALMLCGEGKLSVKTPVAELLPELSGDLPDGLTVETLLRRRSGLPDPMRGELLASLPEDGMSSAERLCRERQTLLANRSFASLKRLLGGQKTLDEPFAPSSIEPVLLAELCRRAAGRSVGEYQRERIFEPLGIDAAPGISTNAVGYLTLAADDDTLFGSCGNPDAPTAHRPARTTTGHIPFTPEVELPDAFTVGLDGLERLCATFCRGELLEAKGWELAASIARGGRGMPFEGRGFLHGVSCLGGWQIDMMMRPGEGTGVLIAANEPPVVRREAGQYRRFPDEVLSRLAGQVIRPSHTRLEPVTARNLAAVLRLSPAAEQEGFTAAPAEIVAEAALCAGECFLALEGGTAVGMVALSGHCTRTGRIEALLVDRRHQRKGFGRIITRWAVTHLTEGGAREISLCVDRRNAPAISLYKGLGFVVGETYDEVYVMHLKTQQNR